MKFKKGDTVIYPQHGACKVEAIRKEDPLKTGKNQDYLVLKTVIGDMTLRVPMAKVDEVGVRPPVSPDELEDLVSVLAKADPRVPSNWSRRFKNHQEKLKSGDVYQVAEVVRNLAARNRDASLSAAERTMYERARVNLISEIAPALKVTTQDAEQYLDDALARGVLKPPKAAKATPSKVAAAPKSSTAATAKPTAAPAKKGVVAKKEPAKKAAPGGAEKKGSVARIAKKVATLKKTAPAKKGAVAKKAPTKTRATTKARSTATSTKAPTTKGAKKK